VLRVGQFGAGFGRECAAGGFVVCVLVLCVLRVEQFGAGLGRECAAGDFVVCVCVCFGIVCAACGTVWSGFEGVSVQQVALWWVCVVVSKGNYMTPWLESIHLFH
jgi:hypothetical protein